MTFLFIFLTRSDLEGWRDTFWHIFRLACISLSVILTMSVKIMQGTCPKAFKGWSWLFLTSGRKTDVWYAIDLDSGIKQQTLKLDGTETVCPMMSNKKAPVFLGRTGFFNRTIFFILWERFYEEPKYDSRNPVPIILS